MCELVQVVVGILRENAVRVFRILDFGDVTKCVIVISVTDDGRIVGIPNRIGTNLCGCLVGRRTGLVAVAPILSLRASDEAWQSRVGSSVFEIATAASGLAMTNTGAFSGRTESSAPTMIHYLCFHNKDMISVYLGASGMPRATRCGDLFRKLLEAV